MLEELLEKFQNDTKTTRHEHFGQLKVNFITMKNNRLESLPNVIGTEKRCLPYIEHQLSHVLQPPQERPHLVCANTVLERCEEQSKETIATYHPDKVLIGSKREKQ